MEALAMLDSIEPADPADRAALLARADADPRYRRLRAHLELEGYRVIQPPAAYVSRLKSDARRAVVLTVYALTGATAQASDPGTPATRAHLEFGEGSDCASWALVSVLEDDAIAHFLQATDADAAVTVIAADPTG